MTCRKEEPIPSEYFTPGSIVSSPGGSFQYEILSYPVCRLYHDPTAQFQFQPHAFEYRPGNEGNYLSYLARIRDGSMEFYLTDQYLKGVKHVDFLSVVSIAD